MIPAGQRPHLVVFERVATTTDEYGQPIPGLSVTIAEAFARISYGSGEERRTAAQEHASQAITVECNYSNDLDQVIVTDRIQFDGRAWDILSVSPLGFNREIHFGAVAVA